MSSAEMRGEKWSGLIAGRPEQAEAITSEAALTVVSAGAGTGKTHTLAQRFAWLLAADPGCGVEDILVLTFTEKAAQEMRERIHLTVGKWYAEFPRELSHLNRSLRCMEDASISTIHSFAMKIIRESALTLDIDPTASIVPAPKEELWWERYAAALGTLSPKALPGSLDAGWRARARELFGEPAFADFVSEYGPKGLAEAAKSASEVLGSAGKSPEELWYQTPENLLGDVRSLEGFPAMVRELWLGRVRSQITAEMRSKPGVFARLAEVLEQYAELEPNAENDRNFCFLLFSKCLAQLPGRSNIKSAIENALEEPLKQWRNREGVVFAKSRPPSEEEIFTAGLLNRTCALGWKCWDFLRASEGVLSMNDLIRFAGEALEKTPGSGERFKHILVDEFQDTDKLQDRLLESLWREGSNTLFIVGDLKQSIYRFRHADLRIFQNYIEKARTGESENYKYITLDRSYRTGGALLAVFNNIFSKLWADGLEKGSSMRYEPLARPEDEAWWRERNSSGHEPPMEILLSAAGQPAESGDGEKETLADARLRLFRELGRKFHDMRSGKKVIWDKNGDKQGFRPVEWRDMAVLVPSRGVYRLIEQAFGEQGIPCVLCTSKNYFSRGEVSDIVNLVSLLAEPENPLYLAGWISSPFSGAAPEEAKACLDAALSQKATKGGLPLAGVVKMAAPKIWENLERLRKLALLRGVSFAILDLLRTPSFLAFYEPRQRRGVTANIVRLSAIAGEYESSEGRSLVAFSDYLKMMALSEQQKEEPDVVDGGEDAVRILTIHASKGLEYPVVAVLCDGANKNGDGPVFISPRYGAGAVHIPAFTGGKSAGEKTSAYLWHSCGEKTREAAEKERLYYVALTRARDKLILCAAGRYDEKANACDLDSCGPFIKAAVEAGNGTEAAKPEPSGRIRRAAREPGYPEQKNTRLELAKIFPARLGRLSATAYAMLAWCPMAYRIAYRQGRNVRWITGGGAERGGADFGNLAHWIMERWDFRPDTISEWLLATGMEADNNVIRAAPPHLRELFRRPKARGELREILSRFAESGEGKELAMLASAGKLNRETPFRVIDGTLQLDGSIDLMWEDEAGVNIRDWKTTAEETAPAEYYAGQLEFYAYAVSRYRKEQGLADKKIVSALNYLRPGKDKSAERPWTGEELKAAGSRVHAAAELALSGAFGAAKERCGKCPWRNDCCEMKNHAKKITNIYNKLRI